VLTCIPDEDSQKKLITRLTQLLNPNGLIYVSDYPLQTDQRNIERYEKFASIYSTYGIFETSDGAVVRHHDRDWLALLLSGFDPIQSAEIDVHTMNGHPARAIQWLMRKK
jgi:hypothetical protein